MNGSPGGWGVWRELVLEDVLLICGAFLLSRMLICAVQWAVLQTAEKVPPRWRLAVLRIIPPARLLIGLVAIVFIVPMLIEPTFRNLAALATSVGLALAFTLKDYGSSLAAGMATVLENSFQPGDWIQVDGAYGEVKSIGPRTTRIVTADDTEVIIPHGRLWSTILFNATSGNRSLLCAADFYLHPDHDAGAARTCLEGVARTSALLMAGSPVTVIVLEKPWGTHYRLKACVKESRDQFLFATDLTVRGKAALLALGMRFAQAAFAETMKR